MRGDGLMIETARLALREFRPTDLEALAKVLSDPETMRFYPVPLDSFEVAAWIERNRRRYQKDGFGLWAMILKPEGELIGDCGLIRQTVNGGQEVEIGYHLRRDLWRNGLATEAARACRDYGFANLPLDRLISLIRPENQPSRRVAEKNGLTLCQEVPWRGFPHVLYAISRHDLTALKA